MDLTKLLQELVLHEFKLWDCLRNGCSEKAVAEISSRIAEIKKEIRNKAFFRISTVA